MGILTKRLNNLIRDEVRKNGLLFDNQIDCAIEILSSFDDDEPRCNHIILKGKTQSGKTGVFTSLYNIIIQLNLAKTMDINKIIYLTGDNSTGLPKQTKERIERDCFIDINLNLDEQKLPIYILKNEDCKNMKKNKEILNMDFSNSIIFLDESHYATKDEDNVIIKFLEKKGLDLKNSNSLVDKRTYFISSSATPYNEIRSDSIECKKTILLETGDNYKGITEFDDFKDEEGRKILNFISKKNKNEIKDAVSLNSFLEMTYKTLYDAFEASKKRKCCIIRLNGKKKLTEEVIDKIGKENKFKVSFANSKKGNIDYSAIEEKISLHCENQNIHYIKEDEFLLIVINGAYRMGISIPNYAKNYIGVVYDCSSNASGIETTEQGLLGRMCGYWDSDEWKHLRIYSNENHMKSLIEFYRLFKYGEMESDNTDKNVHFAPNQYKTVGTYKEIFIEDGNVNEKTLIKCFGESFYEYNISDFMKMNYTKEYISSLKNPNKLEQREITDIVEKIFIKFIEEKNVSLGKYKDSILVEARRHYANNTKGWVKSLEFSKIISSNSRKHQLNEKNVGKYGYSVILDLTDDNNYQFLIRFGHFGYAEKTDEDEIIKGKTYSTYNTINS